MRTTAALMLALLTLAPQVPDYAALYERGVTFDAFLERATERRETWRANVAAATVPGDIAARARALGHTWRILAIAEARCSDSAAALPYIDRLAAAAPGKLSFRIIDSRAGRAVMEAHRTPDGRAATPTLVFIRDDGEVRVWVERPAPLVAWIAEQKKENPRVDVLSGKTKWYADDAGRTTLAEIVTLLEK